MKIAVIGNGIIGYIASEYLINKGHEVECISPNIQMAQKLNQKHYNDIDLLREKNSNQIVSIKFKREDVTFSKKVSDSFYQREEKDFFS